MIVPAVLILLAALYLAVLCGSFWLWSKHRRRRRVFPFQENVRLLRQPGETLLKQMRIIDERMMITAMCGAVAPSVVAFAYIGLVPRLWAYFGGRLSSGGILVGASIVAATSILALVIILLRTAAQSSNRYLGYCGERLIAERLRPLERRGWVVLHDVPAMGSSPFNLDHVAIGPAGVFVVETKSPRKFVDVGSNGHRLEFDGTMLTWPDGRRNRWAVDDAIGRAEWLSQTLQARAGEPVAVMPILVFPSWYVAECKPRRTEIRVVNPKYLLGAIASRQQVLTATQINLYARQVALLCRDVKL
jgi:hypothetical protein